MDSVCPLSGEVYWGEAYNDGHDPFPQKNSPIRLNIIWLNDEREQCGGTIDIRTGSVQDALSLINWKNVITFAPCPETM